jgi:hypothetical protein
MLDAISLSGIIRGMITSIQLSFCFLWLHSLPLRRGSNFLFIDQLDAKPFCRGIGILPFSFSAPLEPACLEDRIIIL